jgi:hypothetical protein
MTSPPPSKNHNTTTSEPQHCHLKTHNHLKTESPPPQNHFIITLKSSFNHDKTTSPRQCSLTTA